MFYASGRISPSDRAAVIMTAVFLGASCSSERTVIPPPTDTAPPTLNVISPNEFEYDEDGDLLVDFRIVLSDSGGQVDPAGIQVRSLDGVNGPADGADNLLDAWTVQERDTSLLIFHETLENLLHGGANRIEVSVPDTAGNVARDTIRFDLPHGAFWKTLVTGLSSSTSHIIGLTVCPDDNRAYATAGRSLVVVDAQTVEILAVVRNDEAPDDLQIPLCIPGDPILYVTLFVERFDRSSLQWLPRVNPSFGSVGIVLSRSDSNIIYVGESITGGIALIDRAQAARIGSVPLPPAPPNEFVFDLEVLDGDIKIYATRFVEGGILVADPANGQVLNRVQVGGPNWPDLGRTDAFVLSSDNRSLFVAVLDGDPRGVVEVDTETDIVVRTLPLVNSLPQEIALSPSGERLFVTTQDQFVGSPSQNALIDVPGWQLLQAFPRPRPTGETRFDGGAAFRPDGKLVFVGHNLDVDVYLVRE